MFKRCLLSALLIEHSYWLFQVRMLMLRLYRKSYLRSRSEMTSETKLTTSTCKCKPSHFEFCKLCQLITSLANPEAPHPSPQLLKQCSTLSHGDNKIFVWGAIRQLRQPTESLIRNKSVCGAKCRNALAYSVP